MLFRSFLLAAVCFFSPIAAAAQEAPAAAPEAPAAAPVCATQDADLPPELAGWKAKTSPTAASNLAALSSAVLKPGQAYLALLPVTSAVAYVAPPGKSADPASHSGLFDLIVPVAGTYVVAMGVGAWVDMLRDGVSVQSISHSHGPACSTLRKMVVFDLQPGHYGMQITGSPSANLPIMVARRP